MGRNYDLVELYGISSEQLCPKCNNKSEQHLYEYDVDCGNVFLGNGKIQLSLICEICDNEWDVVFQNSLKKVKG